MSYYDRELSDVQIEGNMWVNIGEFLCFEDFFFDGLFADRAVMSEISRAKERIMDARAKIDQLLTRLIPSWPPTSAARTIWCTS